MVRHEAVTVWGDKMYYHCYDVIAPFLCSKITDWIYYEEVLVMRIGWRHLSVHENTGLSMRGVWFEKMELLMKTGGQVGYSRQDRAL